MSLPGAIERTPMLDRWVQINEDGTITVNTGKVEIGQGIKTAIAMIASEELDVSIDRILVQTADTAITPNEAMTAGSMSVESSGSAVRVASATARQILLVLASETLGVDPATLTVQDGLVGSSDSNEQTDYWSLQGGHPFSITILDTPPLKDPHTYQIVGKRSSRIDLPAKVRGDVAFLQDMILPQMRHGRMVKPPTANATLREYPASLDMPDIQIVRDGRFLAVIADREERAVMAAQRLAANCRWESPALTPLPIEVPAYLKNNVNRSLPVVDGTPVVEPVPIAQVPEGASSTLNATYYRPFQMHGSIGPSAALAQFMNGLLTVYSHSQGVEILKTALASALELPLDRVHVIHAEGAGCYGHNGADDVA
ncbi:MAG: molybdopterin cofactor-binding domain-containing protein, partial [Pseudomonadales bacterium]